MGVHETFEDGECRTGAPDEILRQLGPMPVNHTKKNHFVPCFYSSLWTGGDGKLCEFTRPYDRVKPLRNAPRPLIQPSLTSHSGPGSFLEGMKASAYAKSPARLDHYSRRIEGIGNP
jgi:hypothetical protein